LAGRLAPSKLVAVALSVAVASVGLLTAAPASRAASQSYCGVLVGSSTSWAGSPCLSTNAAWTYSSASYGGSGVIDYLRTGLTSSSLEVTDVALGGTFINVCTYRGGNWTGRLAQFESSGASHTIDGHVDDSPNHTGCQ